MTTRQLVCHGCDWIGEDLRSIPHRRQHWQRQLERVNAFDEAHGSTMTQRKTQSGLWKAIPWSALCWEARTVCLSALDALG